MWSSAGSFALSLLFLFVFAPTATRADSEAGKNVFALASPLVFQIVTSVSKTAPKQSYGSGFVVHRDGYLLTNYHVISSVIQDPSKRFQAYLKLKDKAIEAQIIDFDILNDVALVKVDHTFSGDLAISYEEPGQGETIYSIGLPKDLNLSIIEGKYNGTVFQGFTEQIHMSSPLNAGMSGGPTLDSKGRVIGLNVSILRRSQNISFGVPIVTARKMLEKIQARTDETSAPAPITSLQQANKKSAEQIRLATDGLLTELAKVQDKTRKFANWQVQAKPRGMKCWSSRSDIPKQLYDFFYEQCDINAIAYINSIHSSAFYTIDYNTAINKKLNTTRFYSELDKRFRKLDFMPPIYVGEENNQRFYTKYHCKTGFFENKHKVGFKMKYCIVGYLFYPDLYEINFNAVSVSDNEKSIQMILNAYGFTREGIQVLISTHLEKIKDIE